MTTINRQPLEAVEKKTDGQTLDVIKVWGTIQGEGPLAGTPAVFVRLAGCNLMCPACDTLYTDGRHEAGIGWLEAEVKSCVSCFMSRPYAGMLVVLTGGEPFRQNITPFVKMLLEEDFRVQIETNGAAWQEDFGKEFGWFRPTPLTELSIVCSPKAIIVHHKLQPYVSALKYVVSAGAVSNVDGLPLRTLGNPNDIARPWSGFTGEIFVQPADEQDPDLNKANLAEAVRVCMRFGYRLSIQTHKLLGVE